MPQNPYLDLTGMSTDAPMALGVPAARRNPYDDIVSEPAAAAPEGQPSLLSRALGGLGRAWSAVEEAPAIAAQYYGPAGARALSEAQMPRVPTIREDIESGGLSPDQIASEGYGERIGKRLAGTVAGLATSPTNAALLLGTAGLGNLATAGRTAGAALESGVLVPEAATAAARVASMGRLAGLGARGTSLGFAAQMVPDVIHGAGDVYQKYKAQGLTPEVAADVAGTGLEAAMAAGAVRHGLASAPAYPTSPVERDVNMPRVSMLQQALDSQDLSGYPKFDLGNLDRADELASDVSARAADRQTQLDERQAELDRLMARGIPSDRQAQAEAAAAADAQAADAAERARVEQLHSDFADAVAPKIITPLETPTPAEMEQLRQPPPEPPGPSEGELLADQGTASQRQAAAEAAAAQAEADAETAARTRRDDVARRLAPIAQRLGQPAPSRLIVPESVGSGPRQMALPLERPEAPVEAQPPARPIIRPSPAHPFDILPADIRPQADAVVDRHGPELLDTGRYDESVLGQFPPEHQELVKTQIVKRAAAIQNGRDLIDRLRAAHGDVAATLTDGPHQIKTSSPEAYDVIQVHKGEIVGGAEVRNGDLVMIGGGNAPIIPAGDGKFTKSPVSVRPVYETVDAKGARRNDSLTEMGLGSRDRLRKRYGNDSQAGLGADAGGGNRPAVSGEGARDEPAGDSGAHRGLLEPLAGGVQREQAPAPAEVNAPRPIGGEAPPGEAPAAVGRGVEARPLAEGGEPNERPPVRPAAPAAEPTASVTKAIEPEVLSSEQADLAGRTDAQIRRDIAEIDRNPKRTPEDEARYDQLEAELVRRGGRQSLRGVAAEGAPRREIIPGADAARARIAERALKLGKGSPQAGLDPQIFADYALVGADYMAQGLRDFSRWSARMLNEFGELGAEHLSELWNKSMEVWRQHKEEREVRALAEPVDVRDTGAVINRANRAVSYVDGNLEGPRIAGDDLRDLVVDRKRANRLDAAESFALLHREDPSTWAPFLEAKDVRALDAIDELRDLKTEVRRATGVDIDRRASELHGKAKENAAQSVAEAKALRALEESTAAKHQEFDNALAHARDLPRGSKERADAIAGLREQALQILHGVAERRAQGLKFSQRPAGELPSGPPVRSLEQLQQAFPKNVKVSATEDGKYAAELPNGETLQIDPAGNIELEQRQVEAALGRKPSPGARAVASFERLESGSPFMRFLAGVAGIRDVKHEWFHYNKSLPLPDESFGQQLARAFGFGKKVALTGLEREQMYQKYGPIARQQYEARESGSWSRLSDQQRRLASEEVEANAYADFKPETQTNSWFSKIRAYFSRMYTTFAPTAESAMERIHAGDTIGEAPTEAGPGLRQYSTAAAEAPTETAQEEEPLGRPMKPGEAPRVETKVADYEAAKGGLSEFQQKKLKPLARDAPETWKSLDPEIRDRITDLSTDGVVKNGPNKGKVKTSEQKLLDFYDHFNSGKVSAVDVQVMDALVAGRKEAYNNARVNMLQAEEKGFSPQASKEYLQAAIDSATADLAKVARTEVQGRTKLARALAAAARVMKSQITASDPDAFLRKIFRELPNVSEKQAGELLTIYKQRPRDLNGAIHAILAENPKRWQKFMEVWKNGLVSGIGTQAANIAGNVGEQLVRVGETGVASTIDRLAGGERTRLSGEARMEAAGLQSGFKKSLGRLGGDIRDILKLEPEQLKVEMGEPLERQVGAISGKTGRAVRVPFRLLGAFDNFFKGVGGEAEVYKRAWRAAGGDQTRAEGIIKAYDDFIAEKTDGSDLPSGFLDNIQSARQERTFQNPNKLALAGTRLRNDLPILHMVMPFLQTPANIARVSWQRSPGGFWEGYKALAEYRKAVAENKPAAEIAELRGTAMDKLARPIVGTALLTGFAALAKSGGMTGSGPTDPKTKNALRETGWQPYSFVATHPDGTKTYVPFNRFEPVSTVLGFAADMVEAADSKTAGDLATKALGSIAQNITSKTYLQGIADAAEFINDPMRAGGNYIRSMAGSLVPNIVAKGAQAIDPTLRDVKPTEPGVAGFLGSVGKTVESRIPGLSETLPAQRSGTGETIERPGNAATRFLSPVQPSEEKAGTQLERLLVDLDAVRSSPGHELAIPGAHGQKVTLTQEERDLLSKADLAATRRLREVIKDPQFTRMQPEEQKALIEKVYAQYRTEGRRQLYQQSDFRRRAREAMQSRLAS